MSGQTVIKLTDEQRELMKQATGEPHEEIKVETAPVGSTLEPRVAPKMVRRLAAKRLAAKRLAAKRLAAKRLAAKRLAAKRLAAKRLAAKRLAAKRLAAKRIAAKRIAAKGTKPFAR